LKPKILIQDIRNLSLKRRIVAVYDDEQYYNLYTLHNIVSLNPEYELKYILAILSSTLMNEYFRLNFKDIHIKPRYLSKLPITSIPLAEQTPFIEKADFMLENNKVM
jgi:hypothetical protein